MKSTDRAAIADDFSAADAVSASNSVPLAGRVLDELGQPIADAFVYFGPIDGGLGGAIGIDQLFRAGSVWADRITESRTDASGRYTVDAHKLNPTRVVVRSSGHAPFSGDFRLPARGEDYPDIVLQPSVFLEGRVFDHLDRPVEGARVEVLPPRSTGLVINIEEPKEDAEGGWRTDSAGRFAVDELVAGPYRLRVTHPSAPTAEVNGSSTAAGDRVTGIEVHLAEGAEIRGSVAGVPAGRAAQYVVVAQPSDVHFGGFDLMGGRSQVLADDGSFRLRGLRKGRQVKLALYESGERNGFWGDGLAEPAQAMPGESAVRMQFRGAISLRLRAIDAETGSPIESFELEAGGWWRELLAESDGKPIQRHADGVAQHEGFNTRDDNTFDVVVRADGYDPFERNGLSATPGTPLDLGDVRLTPVPEVVVKVTEQATGAPIEFASVSMRVEGEGERGFGGNWRDADQQSATTDADGIARLSSRPGRTVYFSVSHKQFADLTSEPIVLTDASNPLHELRLLRGGTVEIAVLEASGEPLAGSEVERESADAEPYPGVTFDSKGDRKTDQRGKLKFQHLPPGVHYFRIAAKERSSMTFFGYTSSESTQREFSDEWKPVTVVEGGEHTLTLHAPPSSSLTGRILENGKPLVGAQLTIATRTDDDGSSGSSRDDFAAIMGGIDGVKTDAKGRFEFTNESVGAMRLTIEHPLRVMPARYDLDLEEGANEVDIDLDVCTLSGRVTRDDGTPVVGAEVSVQRAGSSEIQQRGAFMISTSGGASITTGVGMQGPVVTDSDGRYLLRGVASGSELVMHVDSKDSLLKAGKLEVPALAPREERSLGELKLLRAGSLRVAISASAASEDDFFRVTLKPLEVEGDAESSNQYTQSPGEARFTGLLPGTWTLSAKSMNARVGTSGLSSESRTVTIVAGEEQAAELILR